MAAVQEEWDYTPLGGDMCSGSLVNFTEEGAAVFEAGTERIGSKYLKARFVEYTDASFTQRKVGDCALSAGVLRCQGVGALSHRRLPRGLAGEAAGGSSKRCSSPHYSAAAPGRAPHLLRPPASCSSRRSITNAPLLPTYLQNRSAEWAHLGLLGPTLRAEVGDVINVTLKNMLPSERVSMHPHGVLYTKASEGAPYNDGTPASEKQDDAVKPSECSAHGMPGAVWPLVGLTACRVVWGCMRLVPMPVLLLHGTAACVRCLGDIMLLKQHTRLTPRCSSCTHPYPLLAAAYAAAQPHPHNTAAAAAMHKRSPPTQPNPTQLLS